MGEICAESNLYNIYPNIQWPWSQEEKRVGLKVLENEGDFGRNWIKIPFWVISEISSAVYLLSNETRSRSAVRGPSVESIEYMEASKPAIFSVRKAPY